MAYEGVLARIPGLGGYLAGQEQDEKQQMGQLQQVAQVQGILAKQQAQQEQQEMRGMLSKVSQQAGGDPAKMVPLLLQTGTPTGIKLAEGLKGLLPKPAEGFTLPAGSQRYGADGKLVAEAPMRPDRAQNQSNVARLMEEMAALPEGDPRRETYRNALRKESETPKQISPTVVMPSAPIVQTADDGTVTLYDRSGNVIKNLGKVGKPSATFEKSRELKGKTQRELQTAITELEKATADGGLIDKSTGSGAGALVDMGAAFFGSATPGAVAVGQTRPIFDLVLKMVPRFEGPQSDKDTASYKEAAGNLANPATPNPIKKEAGKEILRLMRARQGQFISKEQEGTDAPDGGAAAIPDEPPPGAVRQRR